MTTKQPLLSLSVLDGSSSAGKLKFWLQSGISVSQAMIEGDGIRLPLSSLINGAFTRQSVTYRSFVDSPPPPNASSMVDHSATLIFSTTNPEQYAMVTIPAVLPSVVLQTGINAGLVLDTGNPAVISLVNTITSGLWCNQFGYDIVELAATLIERRRV
jgi:hypothetical protein